MLEIRCCLKMSKDANGSTETIEGDFVMLISNVTTTIFIRLKMVFYIFKWRWGNGLNEEETIMATPETRINGQNV
nr:hypothetical protein [Alteribacter populi]